METSIEIRSANRKAFCTVVPGGNGWRAYYVWGGGRRTPLHNFSTVEKALEGTIEFSTIEDAVREAVNFLED